VATGTQTGWGTAPVTSRPPHGRAAQKGRAGVVDAAYHCHAFAKAAFVAHPIAGRQERGHVFWGQGECVNVVGQRGGDADIRHRQTAQGVDSGEAEVALLGVGKGDSHVGRNGMLVESSAVAVHPAGTVHCHQMQRSLIAPGLLLTHLAHLGHLIEQGRQLALDGAVAACA